MKIFVDEKMLCVADVADTFLSRFKGLMLKKELLPSSGLLLKKCSRIHTCFMRFTIDVLYLDEHYTVLDSETIAPWRVGKKVNGAYSVLELPKGESAGYPEGVKLQLIN